jgi:defect-in-organelle-trafficking protein DotA
MLAISIPFASIPCLTEAQPISTFTSVITSFLNMLLLPMFVSGCMMLFYLPAVPFMIFTFGTLGWIIGVIEAMVAAPVVGFAIMSPEGNDIFGKGDPAVMILLNVFLRPSLMIFGLIAGIMISYIGVWLINDGFGSILPTIAFAGDNLASLIVGLIAIPMIYMIMAMQVINRSFTLIHVLPDKVTRWIAGGNVEQLGSEMAGAEKDAKSSAQGGMKDLGKGAQGAGDKYRSEKTKKSEGDGNDVGAK